MYFIVEFEDELKVVEAGKTATLTEVAAKAFGFEPLGDRRTRDVLCIGAFSKREKAELAAKRISRAKD